MAFAVLLVASIGLFAAVRATHQTKIAPLDVSRSTPFDDRADWNQFQDPESVRRFEDLTRATNWTCSLFTNWAWLIATDQHQ